MFLIVISLIIAIFLIVISKRITDYWRRKGVYHVKRTSSFVNIVKNIFFNKDPVFEIVEEAYQEIKNHNLSYGATFGFSGQSFIPVDPELIKHILVKDFDHFTGHSFYYNEKVDPLSAHLFNLNGVEWKKMRQQLTPTFTSGKMKMMFQTMLMCTEELKSMLDEYAEKKEPVSVVDSLARLTTDIIANVAFGIECNSVKNPNNEFRQYGIRIGTPNNTILFRLKRLLVPRLPTQVIEFFKIKMSTPDLEEFFLNVVKKNALHREENSIVRKDFFQLLLQLKNIGKVTDSGQISNEECTVSSNKLTIEQIAAQCFLFFIAGFDTSSNVMAFTLYELAVNQNIQTKVRDSINNVLAKYNGEITYEALNEMSYLQMVINEAMRKYPVLGIIPRACSKDYKVPNSDVVIDKGTMIWIPVAGLHRDPDLYPDPLRYNPERFSAQNMESLNSKCVYLPFGEGPRQCIGLRFGLLQSKVGLAMIIKNYHLRLNEKSSYESMKFKSGRFVTTPKDDIYLDLTKV